VNFRHYVESAQIVERAKFDLIFVADAVAARDGNLEALKALAAIYDLFDPTMLMAGIAACTTHIGLVVTGKHEHQRALQHRAALCLARLDQRRPRRVER
jgi:N-acetyl-S-(2-succino)cysteine monooxygenase